MFSEKTVRYKDVFAGTIDILCGVPDFDSGVLFDEDTHTYSYNGKQLESVTRMLKTGEEYIGVPEDVLHRAAERGTQIHQQIEVYLKHGIESDSYEFCWFKKIYEENKAVFEEPTIIDIKTYASMGKEQKKKTLAQIDLYALAVKEMTGVEIKNKYIIWLPKEPKKGKLIKLKGEDLYDEFSNVDW